MNRAMNRSETGAWGEARAAEYLEKEGYRIIVRNFRCRMGEIDLIARKGSILVFAEVKLRKDASHGEPREFVTASKQQKLRTTAAWYLTGHEWAQELQARFDVIEIYAPAGTEGTYRIEYLENAFE